MTKEQIIEAIKIRMIQKRLTQAELSARAGISPATISKILNGNRQGKIDSWDKILDVLDLEFTIKEKEKL